MIMRPPNLVAIRGPEDLFSDLSVIGFLVLEPAVPVDVRPMA